MALDNVVSQILASAQQEADKLVKDAEGERSSILHQADESIAAKKKVSAKELEQAVLRLRQQELSSAELEAKRVVLNQKKEVLDDTFQQTLKELNALPADEKARLYNKIVSKGSAAIPHPKVYCPKGEGRLLAGAIGVRTIQETDMEPGLVLESEDGSISLDYRFKTILEGVWEKELKNVSHTLFG